MKKQFISLRHFTRDAIAKMAKGRFSYEISHFLDGDLAFRAKVQQFVS
ncbi:hypothetical protein [Streptococcus dysgalactiae]|nr:hypothetical protein [Streptococcus dysgalactiae]